MEQGGKRFIFQVLIITGLFILAGYSLFYTFLSQYRFGAFFLYPFYLGSFFPDSQGSQELKQVRTGLSGCYRSETGCLPNVPCPDVTSKQATYCKHSCMFPYNVCGIYHT